MKRRVRRARNEPPVVQERWRPGLLHLVGIAAVLSVVAVLLRNNQGVRLGLPGAFVWLMAFFIAFGLGLAYRAPFLLPPEAEDESGQGWREGLRMLAYHFTVLMLPPGMRRRYHRRREDIPPQLSPSFAEFQAGFVPSHLALALGRGSGYARATGPGYVRLRRGERITHLVDLRRQVRRKDVEAFTRDGIAINTSIAVTFRVREPQQAVDSLLPFPYEPESIFRLTYSDGVSDDAEIPWSERISPQAAALLVTEISRHRLDQFYQLDPEAPDAAAPDDEIWLSNLVTNVGEALAEQLQELFSCTSPEDCPIQILSISISHLQPPQDVVEQRIRNWQSAWERRKLQDHADSTAYAINALQHARGDALRKMILEVTNNVAEMGNGDRNAISKVLMVRMADMLDRLMGDNRVRLETPQEVFDAVHKTANLLKSSAPESDQS